MNKSHTHTHADGDFQSLYMCSY